MLSGPGVKSERITGLIIFLFRELYKEKGGLYPPY